MAKSAIQKIAMNPSENIAYDKLVLSQENVRRVKDGVTIEQLADDIGRRKLLQSLNVRPVLDGNGEETGTFEVPAGGRRYLALGILVKQKRLAKNEPIPCIVNRSGTTSAEEDSLAENVHRENLLGSVSQLSSWVRTAVMVPGNIGGAYRGRHSDVRVKRSRSVARTTLDAAATPQAFDGVQAKSCTPATWRTGEREGNPSQSKRRVRRRRSA